MEEKNEKKILKKREEEMKNEKKIKRAVGSNKLKSRIVFFLININQELRERQKQNEERRKENERKSEIVQIVSYTFPKIITPGEKKTSLFSLIYKAAYPRVVSLS